MNTKFNKINNSLSNNISSNEPHTKVTTVQNIVAETLGKYTNVVINDDKTINYEIVDTTYFFDENVWKVKFFKEIPQFKQITKDLNDNNNIEFNIKNTNVNNELKFVVYNKIFSESWNLKTTVKAHRTNINRVSLFINEKYPYIKSLSELDVNKSRTEWIDWLVKKNIKTTTTCKYIAQSSRKEAKILNSTAKFFGNVLNEFNDYTDIRDEWNKDRWNVRNLEKYGIKYNQSNSSYSIDFTKINNLQMRASCKQYFKNRLISQNNLTWGTVHQYMSYIPTFLNHICKLNPTWNDLKNLQRHDMEKYIEWLHIYANKNSNPNKYVNQVLIIIEAFLEDIQLKELEISPDKNVKTLIRMDDKPKVAKKSDSDMQYVPDYVLEQLFDHINDLPEKIIPIVYVMFKTGLRISDALELNQDCLVTLDNEFWIQTDIRKVNVENHTIPIDKELADILAIIISKSKEHSNSYNNPNKYLFVNYSGAKRGYTYTSKWVQTELNKLSLKYNITDSNGKIFHFKNHAFRHTYAIKLLNKGVDIVTVQNLLAHASPEMTMRYAKLLDSTKREVFNKAVKAGVFKFDESDKLRAEDDGNIPDDILEMLFTNHKLNAISTPYGSCMQRKNGKCNFAKLPPCLTCNGGSPCKDLCIGATEDDIKKYEILIESTNNIINNAKIYNRDEIVDDNQQLLNLFENIYSTISSGNIIYGRLDKLKKQ